MGQCLHLFTRLYQLSRLILFYMFFSHICVQLMCWFSVFHCLSSVNLRSLLVYIPISSSQRMFSYKHAQTVGLSHVVINCSVANYLSGWGKKELKKIFCCCKAKSSCFFDGLLFSVQIFPGNSDNNVHKKNIFEPPIYGRYVRILPWEWHDRITLRMELLGCDE